ncbi:hypothetical protein [Rhodobacter sp. NSM]|uniref:hypothetical protein n=1 Tax=Rhodobacter sp. NSM TaxID=3457501 RepID=UPI003FD5E8CE
MSATVTSSRQMRVTLLSAPQCFRVAAGLISRHLGLERPLVSRLLAQEGAVLSEGMPAAAAERLSPLLAALGVIVRLDPTGAPEEPLVVDVAVQPLRPTSEATLARLATHLRQEPEAIRAALAGRQGLLLSLCQSDAEALRHAFRRDGSLRIALSSLHTARYDLFLKPGCAMSAGLQKLLRQLGLAPCLFSGAVGAALDARTARLVLARHGDIVEALNRDFQRFDLFLAEGHDISRPDIADFLATRVRVEPKRLMSPHRAQDIRLESGLSRAAARRFHADYAAIGLETRIELVSEPVSCGA